MKKNIINGVGLLLIVMTCSVFASGPKVGINAAPELMIPIGSRSVALGGSILASVQGTEAIYWNPAGLAMLKGGEATFNYLSYFADMNISNITAGVQAGPLGSIGISVQSLSIGEIPVTTIQAPEGTGEILRPGYLTFGISYARRFTDRINFGTNMKVITERIGNMSASGIAFDLGLQYVTPWNFSFGVVMRNIGSELKFDGTGIEFDTAVPWSDPNSTSRRTKLDMASAELPTSMCMGVAYSYQLSESQKFNISGAYSNNSYGLDNVNAGLEYGLKNMVFLRAGYALPLYPEDYPAGDDGDQQFGLAAGVGLRIPLGGTTFLFDYAYRNMDLFDANQYFSIGFTF
jgi:hypothetical protein